MTEWWIDEPRVLGSANPTTQRLEELYAEGFRAIISLLEVRQSPYYDVSAMVSLGFHRYRIPVQDFCAPTDAQVLEFLATIERAMLQGRVIVHCQAGCGRTGTMAAAYWIKRGMPASEAIAKIRAARTGAIETPEQQNCLLELERALRRATRATHP